MAPRKPHSLLDWKRRVFALYAEVREIEDPEVGWRRWREVRDGLFSEHPQSPIPLAERGAFGGLPFFDYDPALRVLAEPDAAEPRRLEIATSGEDPYVFTRFALVRFELTGEPLELELYWLEAYGGGIFLPFADRTSGKETYGAGRYLVDTVKGADLGEENGRLVLDLNFAYNPSCSYDGRWVCPLAPPPNRLEVGVQAGERILA
jgi:uncharacterized protein (DUF1684 family)